MPTILEETPLTPATITGVAVVYETNDEIIESLRGELVPLTAETKEGYELVRRGIGTLREMRVAIEKRRVTLKADALEWGRKVDGEAKRLTGLILEIEEPLKAKKQAVDDEKTRAKREAEEKEKARIAAEEQAKRDAEEARLKAIREAEAKQLAQERAELAEARRKMDAERAAEEAKRQAAQAIIDAERKAAEAVQRAEAEKLRAERQALDAERLRLEKIAAEQQAKERAEQEAKERAEFELQAKAKAEADAEADAEAKRLAEEKRKKDEEAARLANAKRLEAMRPDVEKINGLGKAVRGITLPTCKSVMGKEFIKTLAADLDALAYRCESFKAK